MKLFALIVGLAGASEAPLLTLERARALALEGQPELKASLAQIEAAEAGERGVDASAWPSLSLSAELSASPGGQLIELDGGGASNGALVSGTLPVDAAGAFEPVLRYAGTLGLSWSAWDFGRRAARRELAAAHRATAEAERDRAVLEVRKTVDSAYLGWLAAAARCDQIEASRGAAEARLEDAEARVEAGVGSGSSLLTLEVARARAELRLAAAETDLEQAYFNLKDLLGASAPPEARPDLRLLHVSPTSPDEEDRVDRTRRRAAEASAQVASRALRPELFVEAAAGLRGQDGFLFPMYRGGVGLRWPLFDGGRTAASVAEAKAHVRSAVVRVEQGRKTVQRRRQQREIEARGAERRIGLASDLLTAARRLAEDTAAQFAEGRADAAAVSRADDEVLDAKARLLEARLDGLRARLGLAGSGTTP